MNFVHRIMYFMNFFLIIFCPFISHLHAPLTQYHTNPSILKKHLFDTDSCPLLFPSKFDPTFDPTLTHHHLQYSIFSRSLNCVENKSMTIHSKPAYQGCSFFLAEKEIGTSCVIFGTKYSQVSMIQKWKAFKNIVEEGETDG